MVKKFFLSVLTIAIFAALGYYYYQNRDTSEKFTVWTIQLKPVAQEVIEQNIALFKQIHPEIKVVWVDIPIAEAQKRTLASILGGNAPDLVNLNPDFSAILAQRGALEYFSEEETKKFIPSTLDVLKYEGKIFALPFYATSSITLYNKKAFEACGYDRAPKTYEELYDMAQNLKDCSGTYPLAINLNENDSLAKILNKYDINSFKNKEQIERTAQVYEMFNDMYKKNLISKDTLSINHREMAEKYMSQNALLVVLGSNFLNMVKENAPDTYKNSDVSYQLKTDEGKYDSALMNLIIPKRAKHKQLAKEFANLLTDTESQIQLAKLTNVIPVNKEALENDYFKNCDENLSAKARCISIEQLENSPNPNFGEQNKKEINEAINKTAQIILLNDSITKGQIDSQITELANTINMLQKQ